MFSSIPQSRIIMYLMVVGLLPIFFVGLYLMNKNNRAEALGREVEYIKTLAISRERKQSLNMTIREHFMGADHFYIDKNLETLTFLQPEIDELQKLANNKYYAGDESVKRRLEFLTGTGNNLLFSEGNVQAYPFFQETVDTFVRPVEVNLEDLKKVLSLIEGQPIGPYTPGPDRPQLIIIDFKLDKKEATENNEVFLLNMKVLKREYS